jgi:hypothetical protein
MDQYSFDLSEEKWQFHTPPISLKIYAHLLLEHTPRKAAWPSQPDYWDPELVPDPNIWRIGSSDHRHLAFSEIRESNGMLTGKGMATAD